MIQRQAIAPKAENCGTERGTCVSPDSGPAAADPSNKGLDTPPRRARIFSFASFWKRLVQRFLLDPMLHSADSPHRLALGAAIGMFVAFTPTIGFQMAIVVLLTCFLRANKAIGVPLVWISNPLTIAPLFYIGYTIGRCMLGWAPLDESWWLALHAPPEGWWSATWFYWDRTVEIAWPLWLGCLLMGLVASIPAYCLVFYLAKGLREAVRPHRGPAEV